MTYIYRVVYRKRSEFWVKPEDSEWRVHITAGNPAGRPYTNAQAVKGIVTKENADARRRNTPFEYKPQRFPLTQEWEDL